MRQSSRVFALALGIAGALSGCAETGEPPAPRPAATAPAGLSLPISINEVMVGPLDHAAHELWDVALDRAKRREAKTNGSSTSITPPRSSRWAG